MTGCQSCTGDFALDAAAGGAGVACVTPYICTNGERIFDAAPAADMQGCRECNSGHTLSSPAGGAGVTCIATTYVCENGNPISGEAPNIGDIGCQTCNRDYTLSAALGGEGVSCVSDMDNDNVADTADNCPNVANTDQDAATGATAGRACDTDIDDDNDGLIEIWTLEQLHNIRYNLAGTSYDDEEADTGTDADTGITTGAGATEHANCNDGNTATTVVLCGYELMQDLDFDLDGDGTTTNPDGTLDTDDTASPHFVVADGGWEPIGTSTSVFTATFEGNGFTINNLAIISTQDSVGLFGAATGARIRNIGIVDASVGYSASVADVNTGGLVGHLVNSVISASHVTGNVYSNSSASRTGGLVGYSFDSFIVASYAAAAINTSFGSGGGLVGIMQSSNSNFVYNGIVASYATGNVEVTGGSGGGLLGNAQALSAPAVVIASYATGDVDVGNRNNIRDIAGGLIGRHQSFLLMTAPLSVISSYATGDVDGSTETDDRTGSLIGSYDGSPVTASYGFGEVTGTATGGISTRPPGITAATALTAANTAQCSNRTYTTQTACTSNSLAITAGAWDSTEMECSAPVSGATAGVDYTTYTTMATCTAPGTKTAADTWTTWDNASNAWVFGTGVAPKLRYADYDGSGSSTLDYCALFLSTITCGANGDELPGQ